MWKMVLESRLPLFTNSEMTGKREQISYRELQKKVSLCAGVIKSQGLVKQIGL